MLLLYDVAKIGLHASGVGAAGVGDAVHARSSVTIHSCQWAEPPRNRNTTSTTNVGKVVWGCVCVLTLRMADNGTALFSKMHARLYVTDIINPWPCACVAQDVMTGTSACLMKIRSSRDSSLGKSELIDKCEEETRKA
ncbi:hypothetical protein RRG08_002457 [Elysia crispata]|uniref:Uncharacterized protein n=1 Tax=Elysia crispata TaxID=231223 RepID=A0AAE1A8A8_9GAST|nr:hypothetical protein RRG08_002457 [Elysia crispata]